MTNLTQAQIDEGTKLLAEFCGWEPMSWLDGVAYAKGDYGPFTGYWHWYDPKEEMTTGKLFRPHESRDDFHLVLEEMDKKEGSLLADWLFKVVDMQRDGKYRRIIEAFIAPIALQFQCAVEVVKEYKAVKENNNTRAALAAHTDDEGSEGDEGVR